MSRLIDADKLIKYIEKSRKENPHNDIKIASNHNFEHFHFIKLVNEQPTAYDVDKVVEQLEDYKMWKELLIYDLDFRERQIIKRALEIVKAGGIDD